MIAALSQLRSKSKSTMNPFNKVKQNIQEIIWPLGSVVKIMYGYLKGYKFVITENSGWSPILGRWEPENHKIFAQLIRPGQTVFDLGANNGIHSLLFSKLVGNNGKVYAFEPLASNIEEIKKNCELNNVKNIQTVGSAVGSYDGEVKFVVGNSNKQGSIKGIGTESGKELSVKLISLRTFIENENIRPDFIKIDIEGAESESLLGMGDLIKKLKPIFFVELHTPEQDKKVGEIFQQFDYTLYRVTSKNVKNDLGIPYVEKIKNVNLTYPHPDGIWGTVLAIPN